jgi:hypothetical protein
MHTIVTDSRKRLRIPGALPQQVFSYVRDGERIVLTPVQDRIKEPFPPGSLKKHFTKTRNREEVMLLKGCVLP